MESEIGDGAAVESERKGGVRIETELWVRVIGRDSEPIRRAGNISASGFFFAVENWPGRAGDIAVMEVSSEDRARSFTTMARVARVVGADEARWSSVEQGVSYQFLPSDEGTRTAIARTVRYIAEQHPEQAGELSLDDFQQAASEDGFLATGVSEGPSIEAGAKVRLVVPGASAGAQREVVGVVGDITESIQADGATRFWVPVFLLEESESSDAAPAGAGHTTPASDSLIDSMWRELVPEAQSMLAASPVGSPRAGDSQLSGRLSQISMPSALWLIDQERLSGALEFRRGDEQITLYIRQGRVIDAESPGAEREPREHLAALMRWEDGDFDFRVEAVEREDRLGVATQGLLLDLAVAADEEGR